MSIVDLARMPARHFRNLTPVGVVAGIDPAPQHSTSATEPLALHRTRGKAWLLLAVPAAASLAHPALAQVADQASSSVPEVVITAQHLNEERSRIDTDTGASTYKFDSKAIEAQPG